VYPAVAGVSGLWFLYIALKAKRTKDRRDYFGLFKFSLVHLFVLFAAILA
jgi:heme O synthase-like polyprenyltransferase